MENTKQKRRSKYNFSLFKVGDIKTIAGADKQSFQTAILSYNKRHNASIEVNYEYFEKTGKYKATRIA